MVFAVQVQMRFVTFTNQKGEGVMPAVISEGLLGVVLSPKRDNGTAVKTRWKGGSIHG
jgi:hypothetical protein